MEQVLDERLSRLAHRVDFHIKTEEADAAEHTKRMNKDFIHFFTWYSEAMYKTQLLLGHYRKLMEVIGFGNYEDIVEYMKGEVSRIEKRLLESQLHQSSSSQSSNIAFIFNLEVEQKIRKEYMMFIEYVESEK